MTLSAKWTVVSFFALSAIGTVAFAGCTVTSGNPTTGDGGTPVVPPSGGGDGSVTPPVDGGGDAGTVCEGNKQTSGDFFSHACQQKLNTVCCSQLKTCFDLPPGTDDAGQAGYDCNAYTKCIDTCTKKADGVTPETDQAKISACDDDCDTLTGTEVQAAYKAIVDCAVANAHSECQ